MSKIWRFFKEYRRFGLVVISAIIGLGLDLSGFHRLAHFALADASLASAIPLIWGMVKDLRSGKYGIDLLAVTAIITSVVLGEYWAAIIIVIMLTGGEALEDYAENRAKTELTALLNNKSTIAHVLRGRKVVDTKAANVIAGDKLIIRPGEIVPVDGVITEGASSFDESSITGESLPVDKKNGDELLSGSVNQEGVITIKALRPAADSQYELIIKLVKAAASTESPFIRLTDRYAVPFTILSFAIAGTAWAISSDAIRFLQVIVVATPCPLLLAAPIALVSGMSRAAKAGIIVKNGSSLERLAQVKTVAFDKTGTLTIGVPVVERIEALKGFSKDEVLRFSAALEQQSPHLLALAIVNAAKSKNIKIPKANNISEKPGGGVRGYVSGQEVLVGKPMFLQDSGIAVPAHLASKKLSNTASLVAVNNKAAGIIYFTDAIRKETENLLSRVKRLGIKHTLMVTGDNAGSAKIIAHKLHIEKVIADALPVDKVRAIDAATYRPVAFVGDGVNDAPVLTAADIGIALGARGSTAASESADVVIMLDDVGRVATSLEIAKRTFKVAKQTILIGIAMSVILEIIYFSGRFTPLSGAILQEGVDVAVIFIALRAHADIKSRKLI